MTWEVTGKYLLVIVKLNFTWKESGCYCTTDFTELWCNLTSTATLFRVFHLWSNSAKTNWDNKSGSVSQSGQMKIVMEAKVVASKPSYILSGLKVRRFCSPFVVEVVWWFFLLLMLCNFEAIALLCKSNTTVLIDSMWFGMEWQTSHHWLLMQTQCRNILEV